jgi:lysine 2,3-aminomutase
MLENSIESQEKTEIICDIDEPPLSPKTLEFKNKFYPNTTLKEWNSWEWQIRNSITTKNQLEKILVLTEEESSAFENNINLPFKVTPYYMSLIINNNELRKTVIPTIYENVYSDEEFEDPLEEEKYRHGCVIHKYPNRALFISTNSCSTFCRYCTRSRIMHKKETNWEEGLNYIKDHEEITDVIVSGGDPLCFSDEKLEYLLSKIREIKHVEIIRIGTKVLCVLPSRITNKLVEMLKKYHPLFINIHVTNGNELVLESKNAITKLVNAGIVIGSQTVLLNNINDNIEILNYTMRELLKARVKPYYLYSCDKILGSSHFRVPILKGKKLIKQLREQIGGLGVPQFIIDTKTKKVPIIGNYKKDLK